MPDTIGFALSTAVLATAFTIFGIIGRIVDGVAAEIRYTVAPAMISGVRAWGRERTGAADRPVSAGAPPDEPPARGRPAPPAVGREAGYVVPVTPLPRRGWHLFGRLMRRLVTVRPRGTGVAGA